MFYKYITPSGLQVLNLMRMGFRGILLISKFLLIYRIAMTYNPIKAKNKPQA